MTMTKLDFSGKGTASDTEIESVANDIFNLLIIFDSPKDASSAFTLAYLKMLKAAFPPEYRKEAIDAVESNSQLVIAILNEGWQ